MTASPAPRVTMIGVGNLMEVIWPIVEANIGGEDVASRFIGVTADEADIERKAAHFGFEMVLDDSLGALRRNHPDLVLFAPPPSVAPRLIDEVLRPYYAERRSDDGQLPVLYAFPPVPAGAAYLDALGDDVLVANIIPNNVTTIGGSPVDDEGFYVCSFPSPWPDDQLDLLRRVFAGQGANVRLEPGQLIPMLGGAATVSALWFAAPAIADLAGVDHNELGRFLRAHLARESEPEPVAAPPRADVLGATIDGWHDGVERYYAETDIEPDAARTLLTRGLDLTLHTIAVEPRSVLTGHSVGAATRGGVLEKAIDETGRRLLPAVEAALGRPTEGDWRDQLAELVTDTCRAVGRHGATLAG